MHFEYRHFGSALAAHAALALCLSCSSSDPSKSDDSGSDGGSDSPSSAANSSGTMGTSGTMTTGTTGSVATTGPGTTGSVTTSAAVTTTGSPATTGGDSDGSGSGGSGTSGTDGAVGTGGGSPTGAGGTGGDATTGTDGPTTDGTGTTGGGTDPAPSEGCDSPAGVTSGPATIDVDGLERKYILFVPDNYDPSHPYKLVFGWHPWGGSADQTANMGYFGLEDVSDGQAILVAPEGTDYQDNGLGWANENGRDVAFYHAMLDLFSSQLCIDQNRIFSTGFSFGAMFSFTLGCEQDSMIRAIAPQAGNAQVAGCENGDRSVATMAFIGVDDSLIDGHRQAVQTFVGRNGCSTEPVTLTTSWCDGLDSEFSPCECVEYPDCTEGQPVISCEYKAGHRFAPDSGETIWNFFSQF